MVHSNPLASLVPNPVFPWEAFELRNLIFGSSLISLCSGSSPIPQAQLFLLWSAKSGRAPPPHLALQQWLPGYLISAGRWECSSSAFQLPEAWLNLRVSGKQPRFQFLLLHWSGCPGPAPTPHIAHTSGSQLFPVQGVPRWGTAGVCDF